MNESDSKWETIGWSGRWVLIQLGCECGFVLCWVGRRRLWELPNGWVGNSVEAADSVGVVELRSPGLLFGCFLFSFSFTQCLSVLPLRVPVQVGCVFSFACCCWRVCSVCLCRVWFPVGNGVCVCPSWSEYLSDYCVCKNLGDWVSLRWWILVSVEAIWSWVSPNGCWFLNVLSMELFYGPNGRFWWYWVLLGWWMELLWIISEWECWVELWNYEILMKWLYVVCCEWFRILWMQVGNLKDEES